MAEIAAINAANTQNNVFRKPECILPSLRARDVRFIIFLNCAPTAAIVKEKVGDQTIAAI
jgi:hypothetical protein